MQNSSRNVHSSFSLKGIYASFRDILQFRNVALNHKAANKLVNQALQLHHNGERPEAMAKLSEAIAVDPCYHRGYAWRGNLYAEGSEYQNAIADFDKAIGYSKDEDERIIAFLGLGLCHLKLGNFREAIGNCQEVILLFDKAESEAPEVTQMLQRALQSVSMVIDAYEIRAEAYEGSGQDDLAQADRAMIQLLRKKNSEN